MRAQSASVLRPGGRCASTTLRELVAREPQAIDEPLKSLTGKWLRRATGVNEHGVGDLGLNRGDSRCEGSDLCWAVRGPARPTQRYWLADALHEIAAGRPVPMLGCLSVQPVMKGFSL